ncbi:hypothetical protein AVEN_208733-1, partial [Araneus ventricosus]
SDGDVSLTIPDETKAIGLLWRPQKDSLAFSVSGNVDTCESCKITKRSVLSTTARIFDPLGLISPVVTKAKLVMQELRRLKLDWNDSLPIQLESRWKRFVTFLTTINTLNIPRYIFLDYALKIEQHGFADASEKAYGAAIYVSTVLWTGSTIVLAWIQKDPSVLKPFVRNRVRAIQNLTEVSAWQHVPSKENPADIISRGIDPEKIQDCNLWWFGPSFLQDHSVVSPCVCSDINDNELYQREFKKTPTDPVCLVVQGQEVLPIINNCSSFTRLQRVIGWCMRFVRNAKNSLQPSKGNLTSPELFKSLMCLVKNVQANCFAQEIQCLKSGQQLPNSSSLINLSPFLDEQDILRVGGRLKNSNLPIERKHPILLPYNNHFSDLIINHFHVLYLHTGAEATLANIRTKFWLINGRNCVRKIIRKCIPCLKSVHLEIVNSCSTDAFIGALKRFIARRGKPSDNGTNFVGANNVLNKVLRKILKDLFNKESTGKIEDFIASEGIVWHFNPPATPHFGGLWEAGVKSLKARLKRVVGNTVLTHEEFSTLVTQVEAVLNSRPLCNLSSDPNDDFVLTPAHFLVGSSLTALPDPDLTEVPMNRLNRWQLVQRLSQIFWKKWSKDYLNRLQSRVKWRKGDKIFKENEIVLVKNEDNSKTFNWNLAKIIKVHAGKDNVIRVVTVKTNKGIYQRTVNKIIKLPFYD